MILSDREIRLALARGSIRITPFPGANVWSSTAIDLTLDGQVLRRKPPGGKRARRSAVSPADPDFDRLALIAGRAETVPIPDDGYEMSPGSFCLGWTTERIQLPHPSRLAARGDAVRQVLRRDGRFGEDDAERVGLGVVGDLHGGLSEEVGGDGDDHDIRRLVHEDGAFSRKSQLLKDNGELSLAPLAPPVELHVAGHGESWTAGHRGARTAASGAPPGGPLVSISLPIVANGRGLCKDKVAADSASWTSS
jgi:hypothetical protein